MSKLCIAMPPFAPDYSGAASALFDLGGMIVIHDASGCTGNYTGFDEPRWFGSNSAVFCSGLRHMDAVLGNDQKLIEQIIAEAQSLKPNFIALIGSPVPMVIGTDFEGIANEIEALTQIPTIGLDTRGLAYYGKGICAATVALMKKMVKAPQTKIAGAINLLGITPLDFYINGNDEDFKHLFVSNGYQLLTSFSMGLTIEALQRSTSASLNIALSQAGVQIAQYMEQTYQIPYMAITPLGNGEIALEAVQKALANEYIPFVPETENAEILIVGEQIIANSLREYLQRQGSDRAIAVAVLFDVSPQHLAQNDIIIQDETMLRKLLNSGQYHTIIGDPMLKALFQQETKIKFYELPHVAVSSKVHWNNYKRFLSETMIEWLDEID